MISRNLNRIELLNEIFQLFSNYYMFIFTEWVGQIEFRYDVGYSLIAYIAMVFLVNITIIMSDMVTDIYRKRKRSNWEKKWTEFYTK